jgi:hypothetical protein
VKVGPVRVSESAEESVEISAVHCRRSSRTGANVAIVTIISPFWHKKW